MTPAQYQSAYTSGVTTAAVAIYGVAEKLRSSAADSPAQRARLIAILETIAVEILAEVQSDALPLARKDETFAQAHVKLSLDHQRSVSRAKGYTGDSCADCGSLTMVRNGTCLKCETCGGTTGCS